ncbi:SRPBCC family protein [Micromonospora sp. C28SCA-DRY-2]|uniref:SRPBCC family protein n=1 Tax=Micromonospora sp. C28SCA-DRY-2 TaxID=3059522 RepID=UPI0026748615|nr:SRPBCC family protein [Micromonospora sp. C28SCA-DRY-2]MDO3702701.1 SRPBCC family protein [Micromonospora sp. C28SCA-DRY-2]
MNRNTALNRRQAVKGLLYGTVAATTIAALAEPAAAHPDHTPATNAVAARQVQVDVDRDAQVIVDLSITIDAPLAAVWQLHTAIDQWPSWQQDINRAELTGPLRPGGSFAWETHGLPIVSTIREVRPLRRIVWGGPALGIDGVHVWTFTPTHHGVVVHTTESWDGPPIAADPEGMRAALTASLTSWLAALKATAEAADRR